MGTEREIKEKELESTLEESYDEGFLRLILWERKYKTEAEI